MITIRKQIKKYWILNRIYIAFFIDVFIQPFCHSQIWHKVNFKWSFTGLHSEFSFPSIGYHKKAIELCLPYYLHKAGEWFIHLPRVLTLCEMQIALSRISTQITKSFTNNYNLHHKDFFFIYVPNQRDNSAGSCKSR